MTVSEAITMDSTTITVPNAGNINFNGMTGFTGTGGGALIVEVAGKTGTLSGSNDFATLQTTDLWTNALNSSSLTVDSYNVIT
jgi:hypothetical protein